MLIRILTLTKNHPRTILEQMASSKTGTILWRRAQGASKLQPKPSSYTCLFCRQTRYSVRQFTTSPRLNKDENPRGEGPFRSRLRAALRRTKIEWKPMPVGFGIAFLGAIQLYRIREREKRRQAEEDENEAQSGRPRKRKRIRPSGPWSVL